MLICVSVEVGKTLIKRVDGKEFISHLYSCLCRKFYWSVAQWKFLKIYSDLHLARLLKLASCKTKSLAVLRLCVFIKISWFVVAIPVAVWKCIFTMCEPGVKYLSCAVRKYFKYFRAHVIVTWRQSRHLSFLIIGSNTSWHSSLEVSEKKY